MSGMFFPSLKSSISHSRQRGGVYWLPLLPHTCSQKCSGMQISLCRWWSFGSKRVHFWEQPGNVITQQCCYLYPQKTVRHTLCHTHTFKRSGLGEAAALFGEAEITSCTPSQQHVGKIKFKCRCWTGRSVCHDRRQQWLYTATLLATLTNTWRDPRNTCRARLLENFRFRIVHTDCSLTHD